MCAVVARWTLRRRLCSVDKRSVRNVRWDEIDDRNSQTTNKFWQNGRYKLVMSTTYFIHTYIYKVAPSKRSRNDRRQPLRWGGEGALCIHTIIRYG